jgi:hypothetical protein
MKINCENCVFFDGSKHQKDARTQHAGICSKWTEIVFRSETCKQHFLNSNPTEKDIFPALVDVSKLPVIQFELFN